MRFAKRLEYSMTSRIRVGRTTGQGKHRSLATAKAIVLCRVLPNGASLPLAGFPMTGFPATGIGIQLICIGRRRVRAVDGYRPSVDAGHRPFVYGNIAVPLTASGPWALLYAPSKTPIRSMADGQESLRVYGVSAAGAIRGRRSMRVSTRRYSSRRRTRLILEFAWLRTAIADS